jgi:SAM-dependent methyltransferase
VTTTDTRWEAAARTAWGSYLTDAEFRVLHQGLDLAPETGGALEVGCEGGRWSKEILRRRGTVNCTDVDQQSLDLCSQRLPEARCIRVSPDDRQLPVGDGELGFMLVYEVTPVTNAPWFPAEAARVLERGGVLVFSHHNPASIRALAYRAAMLVGRRAKSWGFYGGPTYTAFRKSLRAAGFSVIHEEGLAWMPFPRDSDSSLVAPAVRAERLLGLRRLVAVSPWVLAVARRV